MMLDPMTGLWNQNYLDVQLPGQLSLARRTGDPLSCAVSDIDGIEQIYERRGTAVAERIIKSITGTFAGMSRSEDVLCHVGGGRMVFLHTATSHAQAVLLMELMRREIERQLLYLEFMGVGITCSFGVADTRSHCTGSLLDAAEEALSQAKAAGGNTVVSAGQSGVASMAA